MIAELLRRYDLHLPRYTSYPTAPQFHSRIGARAYAERLAALDLARPLSLYLHVPFCAKLCWYCGCNTKIVARYAPIADFVELLAREIALVAAHLPGRARVGHVHWGGGTPTILKCSDFRVLSDILHRHFDVIDTAEIAVEIDPRTVSNDTPPMLAACGVNRVSLGVQDFDPAVQAAINRLQPYCVTASAVDRLRAAGIERLNFDLIYGLPRQTTPGVVATVDRAVSLAPDRLAVFGYAHVPWMKRHQRLIDEAALPDVSARWQQSQAMARRLVENGYVAIGLDHFALPEDEMAVASREGNLHRNFQGYSTDGADTLLGFGPSSIGAFADAYVQNAGEIGAWRNAIAQGTLAIHRGIVLNADDRLRRAVIERIMCDDMVDVSAIAQAQGFAARYFAPELARLSRHAGDGLLRIADARIFLTPLGRPLRRTVAAVFDRYLSLGAERHAKAV